MVAGQHVLMSAARTAVRAADATGVGGTDEALRGLTVRHPGCLRRGGNIRSAHREASARGPTRCSRQAASAGHPIGLIEELSGEDLL